MMILTGDCVEVMNAMEPESVDAIVTDPPYGLEFMGKEWDRLGDHGQVKHGGPKDRDPSSVFGRQRVSFYGSANRKCRTCDHWEWSGTPCRCEAPDFPARNQRQGELMQAFHQQWAQAAYRVAKPSAYLLAFGGTRTVHRMTVALEDAGWIIRDMLVWAYASGFPKSKASLKPAWEPIVMARKPGPLRDLAIDACRIAHDGSGVWGDHGQNPDQHRVQPGGNGRTTEGGQWADPGSSRNPAGRWPANVILTDPIFDGGVEGVVGGGTTTPHGGHGEWVQHTWGDRVPTRQDIEPDSGTYSRFFLIAKSSRSDREPVLGGLPPRIAGIGHAAGENDTEYIDLVYPPPVGIGAWLREHREAAGLRQKDVATHFPSRTGGLTGAVANWELEFNRPTPDQWRMLREVIGFDDQYDEVMTTTTTVPRVRFKPNGKEQAVVHRRNHHPTVKPTDLMRHLVRLVTPTGGTVLDCFAGSGSTLLAAEQEGFSWIGIEREAEYVAIAEARLNGTQRGLGLESA